MMILFLNDSITLCWQQKQVPATRSKDEIKGNLRYSYYHGISYSKGNERDIKIRLVPKVHSKEYKTGEEQIFMCHQ
jgi:hypothetical protein